MIKINGETIKDIEKEIRYLKAERSNINQLLSNLHNKYSTCFIKGDTFPQKPTKESNENIDFTIDTPPQCLTIPLNSMKCDKGHDLLKTKLDEQFHRQKYVNTKPIINNINKSNYLEQKCKLIIEKDHDNIETLIEYKIDSKVARNEQTESVEKTNSLEKSPPEKSTNFHEIQRNFQDSENDNNEESQLLQKLIFQIIIMKIIAYVIVVAILKTILTKALQSPTQAN